MKKSIKGILASATLVFMVAMLSSGPVFAVKGAPANLPPLPNEGTGRLPMTSSGAGTWTAAPQTPPQSTGVLNPSDQQLSPAEAGPKPAKAVKHKAVKKKKTAHHAKKKRTGKKAASHTSAKDRIRTAQVYLKQLGYEAGTADGVMGSKTKMALREFQRDHNMAATGKLTDAAFRALSKEAGSRNPQRGSPERPADFLNAHPDFYGYYGTEGVNPNQMGSPQSIPSRFGTVDIAQEPTGQTFRYVVSFNGKPVYHADNQPAYLNVSRTFTLDDSDAILFTSFENGDKVCPYRHYLMTVRQNGGNSVQKIANCTRDYEAYTQNGLLLITFPGSNVDGLSTGDAWRFDHGALEKL